MNTGTIKIEYKDLLTNDITFLMVLLQKHFRSMIPMIYDSQPAIGCSKLTLETLEQDVKYVQS